PRFWGAAQLYGGSASPPLSRYSATEAAQLAAIVEQAGGALVDVEGPVQLGIFLLVELGQRGLALQWSASSWHLILGYRPWPVPAYPTPMPIRITNRSPAHSGSPDLLLQTRQFDVLRNP